MPADEIGFALSPGTEVRRKKEGGEEGKERKEMIDGAGWKSRRV